MMLSNDFTIQKSRSIMSYTFSSGNHNWCSNPTLPVIKLNGEQYHMDYGFVRGPKKLQQLLRNKRILLYLFNLLKYIIASPFTILHLGNCNFKPFHIGINTIVKLTNIP